ncbi:MAG TPA: hypothetical protein VJJ75_00350 [Candidatus Nanoarchaeia archaeon]|nr:hypothetical protein [Candidatus Nanoarchaeia archaeon]
MVMKHIHTMIERPVEIRRALLEAAIKSTEILRQEDTLKDLRDQKEELKKQISVSLARLKRTAIGIRKSLPPLPKDLDSPHPVRPVEAKEIPGKQRDDSSDKLPVTSRQKLDAELSALRDRIQKLQV